MDVGEIVAIALAGLAAGTINTVVGSGTLITFPVLLAFGYAPVTANVSNTIGLVPGSVSGAFGYRRELAGQRRRVLRLGTMSVLGGATGAVLLLVLPASAFKAIVPVFIALALVLVVLQPRLNRRAGRARDRASSTRAASSRRSAVFATGIYGGYFGAAQGILLLGDPRRGAPAGPAAHQRPEERPRRRSSTASPACTSCSPPHVAWAPAAIIAGASIVGGQLGAHYGRRLQPAALRA